MPSGVYIRTKENTKNMKGVSKSFKGKKNSNMARVGEKNGMHGTKGWFGWRNISGFHSHKKGEYKPSEKTRKKISLANKGKIYKSKGMHRTNSGSFKQGHEGLKRERSPTWLGGVSFEPYGLDFNKELKEKIRERDGYRCQECFRHQDELYIKSGKRRKLTVHHIDYDKKNNKPENLLSLCLSCHTQTNFKREDWIQYFQNRSNYA